MQLTEALGLRSRETVAFVGGGGKTTAMFRLAGELAAAGHRVVTSTSTRLAVREVALAPECLACQDADCLLAALPAVLARGRSVLAVESINIEQDRVGGLKVQVLERIAALADVDFLLVEADGSRELPFKAPAAYEPLIPGCATIVIPVVGLDVLGLPLTSEHVHRPGAVAALAQVGVGEPITPTVVAAVLGHRQGGAKNAPPLARVIPLLNKAETALKREAAFEIARLLLQRPWIERVLIGAVATPDAVRIVTS
jgi:molybdenum cofactor cytidylyltransferase